VKLDEKQRFELSGCAAGVVSIRLAPREGLETIRHRLSDKNKCLNPEESNCIEGQLERDVTDLTILLGPVEDKWYPGIVDADPTALAQFNDATAGPITGVPPGNCPPE
jgi:hypothetical protein